jgi:AraC-like DNA-binding protein
MLNEVLTSKPLFRSSDMDQTIEACSKIIAPHRMRVQRQCKDIDATFQGFSHDDIGLIRLQYGADVAIDADNIENHFLIQHKLSGRGKFRNGEACTDTGKGMINIASPSRQTYIELDANSIHVVFRIKRRLVELYLQDLLQQSLQDPLVFTIIMDKGSSQIQAWTNTLEYLAQQYIVLNGSLEQDHLDKMMADCAINTLLHIQPHNYSTGLFKSKEEALPSHVNLAREFIEENISEPIFMSKLASITGVTARTLQNSFRRYLGQSPTEYIRSVRLRTVHQALRTADKNVSVTDILIRCGVYDFGRFAGLYKKRYGLLPSETLKKGA